MLKKSLIVLFFVFAMCVSSAFAQSVYTPEKGSTERAEILNALRLPLEKELRQKIQFSIVNFNVRGNWAYLDGAPQNASGGKPNFKATPYQEAINAGMFDNNFFALLKKTGNKWKVVKYQIGCTDVCYLPWAKQYKAPRTIFPSTE